jgi:hypothetical protein
MEVIVKIAGKFHLWTQILQDNATIRTRIFTPFFLEQ